MSAARHQFGRVLIAAAAALTLAAAPACTQDVPGLDTPLPTPTGEFPEVGLVRVADGVDLEYRDWGGDGPTIVLLTGLGNSAAVFDDLAPRLTDTHRVIGLTRRGFGGSTSTDGGYDVPTRVADDLAALDALGVDRALLVGHSIAGDEVTGIAQARPNLPVGLVYLDSAVDRTDPGFDVFDECSTLAPSADQVVELSPAEVRTIDGEPQVIGLDAMVRVQEATLGGPVPASEMRRQFTLGADGSVRAADRGAALAAIGQGSEQYAPDYTGIAVPVTALYADDTDPAVAFPLAALAGPEVRATLQDCANRIAAVKRTAGADQVRAAVPDARIEVVAGGPHYFFLQQPELVTEEILATAARAGW